jgi:mannose-6-phosphate isomerase
VLSIQKPLSLQAHPNKADAEVLHARDPTNYPDPNHKPEMGLFITRTSLLYGFRAYSEIINFLKTVPEFSTLIPDDIKRSFISAPSVDTFKQVFTAFLRYPKDKLPSLTSVFVDKLPQYSKSLGEPAVIAIRAIRDYFPEDIGVFCPLLLNAIIGEPGAALYIPAGVLHAYIKGDLYEAMALSDNVVRAAMTPKFVDIDTLLALLNFNPTPPHWVAPTAISSKITKYVPPSTEFLIYRIVIGAADQITLPPFPHEAIVSVLEGPVNLNGKDFQRDSVLLYFSGSALTAQGSSVLFIACYD